MHTHVSVYIYIYMYTLCILAASFSKQESEKDLQRRPTASMYKRCVVCPFVTKDPANSGFGRKVSCVELHMVVRLPRQSWSRPVVGVPMHQSCRVSTTTGRLGLIESVVSLQVTL